MIHKCKTCGEDAILFSMPGKEAELVCLTNWRHWGIEPANRKEIEGGADFFTSECNAMITDFLAVFDKHGEFASRCLAVRGTNQNGYTDFMVQILVDTIFNMYYMRWPLAMKDLRDIRTEMIPQVVRCLDRSFRGLEDRTKAQQAQINEKQRFDA
jgi:hypothetical protein